MFSILAGGGSSSLDSHQLLVPSNKKLQAAIGFEDFTELKETKTKGSLSSL